MRMGKHKMASGSREKVLDDAKSLVELFTRLHETLTKASSKNETLLEAIESSQARASETNNAEVSVEAGLISTMLFIYIPLLIGFCLTQSPCPSGGCPRAKLGTEERSQHVYR